MSIPTPDTILQEAKRRMHSSVEALKKEMTTIRTGRANASLLDNVHVEYYGSVVPVNQMATVSVPEAGMLVVQPFDKSAIKAIETAILKSELGINPGNDGNVIRLPIPMLTEERRRELVKVLHRLGEEIKTGVRNIRRDANEDVKKLEKIKEAPLSEDAAKKALDDIQKLTDLHIKEIDEAMKHKEVEILKV
ncbi:ribosome recycling factor [Geothrix sp. PMB-07]|uniref:ribosome recycling factor n=1 Tax=Geothrix sp. PMB-07 TaxID=3068640 RepID=UPI002740C967|nr:ribosome recycling factor [Geothrix sp. PMB-07]WLT31350.1 ribosome recycling factor [Geothrix sp. PMB-07]